MFYGVFKMVNSRILKKSFLFIFGFVKGLHFFEHLEYPVLKQLFVLVNLLLGCGAEAHSSIQSMYFVNSWLID